MWHIAALNTHLMTKCEINNDVDGMPQWIRGELFIGSGKKYDLKEKQVLVFSETVRRKDVFVAGDIVLVTV